MSGAATYADWIAVDWGTSNLRAWAMRDGKARDEIRSDKGMAGLKPDQFEPVLLDLITPWLGAARTNVVACGMVGARQGWAEAPYSTVPAKPHGTHYTAQCTDSRIAMHILPGLKQANHPDVMRGEETQIAGFLAMDPGFDGVLCLPGTHSKWVRISAGEVVSFQTIMTGEIFDLIGNKSVLRHSIGTDGDWDEASFTEAVADTLSRPEAATARLFQIRASDLLDGMPPAIARARLSGILLGLEIAATKAYWLGQTIALIGAPKLNALYAAALAAQGVEPAVYDGDPLTLAGLTAAHAKLAL